MKIEPIRMVATSIIFFKAIVFPSNLLNMVIPHSPEILLSIMHFTTSGSILA